MTNSDNQFEMFFVLENGVWRFYGNQSCVGIQPRTDKAKSALALLGIK